VVSAPQQRIIIIGAGDAGASLAKEFINAPSRGFKPVMFFQKRTAARSTLIICDQSVRPAIAGWDRSIWLRG
jgi:FlaA1/EpsC-like NDP-sugar epimerase